MTDEDSERGWYLAIIITAIQSADRFRVRELVKCKKSDYQEVDYGLEEPNTDLSKMRSGDHWTGNRPTSIIVKINIRNSNRIDPEDKIRN